jgi:hypothetical protein
MAMSGRNTRAIHTQQSRTTLRLKFHQQLMLEFCKGHDVDTASRMAFDIVVKTSDKEIVKALRVA